MPDNYYCSSATFPLIMKHIVLLGDSIFDNRSYVNGGKDTVTNLREQMPDNWTATLLAVDGSVASSVATQLQRVPDAATHLFLSVGGNDALAAAGILQMPASSAADVFSELASVSARFEHSYKSMLDAVRRLSKPTAICTIYYPNYPDELVQKIAVAALASFNDAIVRQASLAGLPLIDLRYVCNEDSDYANPIEPSESGGLKIARTIIRVVKDHDFDKGLTEVYWGPDPITTSDEREVNVAHGGTSDTYHENTRTSRSHPIRVDFVQSTEFPILNHLGMTFAPGKKQSDAVSGIWDRDLKADLERLSSEFGVASLISLVEDDELDDLQIGDLEEQCNRIKIKLVRFPIRDASMPESINDFVSVVADAVRWLKNGETVVVHCKGGLGRAGLTAACIAIAATDAAISAEESINLARDARPGAVETSAQEQFVTEFERQWREKVDERFRDSSSFEPVEQVDDLNRESVPDADLITVNFIRSDEFPFLERLGITYAPDISLEDQSEIERLDVGETPEDGEVVVLRLQVPEYRSLPEVMSDFMPTLAAFERKLQDGGTIVVHCTTKPAWAGLVAACIAVAAGQGDISPNTAIDLVREAESRAIATPQEEEFVLKFQELWREFLQNRSHYMLYWQERSVRDHDANDLPLDVIASNQLFRVSPGDTVWIVTLTEDRELVLAGRMMVADVVEHEEALQRMRNAGLWQAEYYAFPVPGTEEFLRETDIHHLVEDLRFESENDRLVVRDGQINPQQLQSMRKLTPESSDMLEEAFNTFGPFNVEDLDSEGQVNFFRALVEFDPDDVDAHYNLGVALGNIGDEEGAMAEFRAVLELDPNYFPAQFNIGNTLVRSGRFEEAIEALNQAILINGEYAPAHFMLGVAYFEAGRLEDAIAATRQGLEIDPDDESAHYNIAYWTYAHGEYRRALSLCDTMSARFPFYTMPHVLKGMCYRELGDLDREIQSYLDAVNIRVDADGAFVMNLAATFFLGAAWERKITGSDAGIEYIDPGSNLELQNPVHQFYFTMGHLAQGETDYAAKYLEDLRQTAPELARRLERAMQKVEPSRAEDDGTQASTNPDISSKTILLEDDTTHLRALQGRLCVYREYPFVVAVRVVEVTTDEWGASFTLLEIPIPGFDQANVGEFSVGSSWDGIVISDRSVSVPQLSWKLVSRSDLVEQIMAAADRGMSGEELFQYVNRLAMPCGPEDTASTEPQDRVRSSQPGEPRPTRPEKTGREMDGISDQGPEQKSVLERKARKQIRLVVDGTEIIAKNNPDLYQQVLKFLVDRGALDGLDLPVSSGRARNFLSRTPEHKDGSRFLAPVEYGGYYMESHSSRKNGMRMLRDFLSTLGIETSIPDEDQAGSEGASQIRSISLRDRIIGSLYGLAVCDALGTTAEFKPTGTFPEITTIVGGGPFGLDPGEWTDDTSMALCLAASLVETGGFDAADQMDRFLRWKDEGYLSSNGRAFDIGTTIRIALDKYAQQTGERNPFCGSVSPASAGNGSLMRLAPVPLFFASNPAEAIAKAAESSKTTHGARECVDACRYFAGVLVGALQGRSKAEILAPNFSPVPGLWEAEPLSDRIAELTGGAFKAKRPPQISSTGQGYVVVSLHAALWAFHHTVSFKEGALKVVNLGYDSDTYGAIYGQLAGAFYGLNAIPAEWADMLAQKPLLEDLARRLAAVTESRF